MLKEKITNPPIDWEVLSLTLRREPNIRLSKKYGVTVYCHEPYAEDLCKLMTEMKAINKELKPGMTMKVLDVHSIDDNELNLTVEGFINVIVKLDSEKKFFAMLGIDQETFINNMKAVS